MGASNPPVIPVWTGKADWFSSSLGQKPILLTLGRSIWNQYMLTHWFYRIWLALSEQVSSSAA
jgi:hypothetical protein